MSREVSPSALEHYGMVRVCEEWAVACSTLRRPGGKDRARNNAGQA